jgi:hypothetical protein
LVTNIAINAKSRSEAIVACERRADEKTPGGRGWKDGKQLDNARKIQAALDETNMTFDEIYDRIVEFHAPIAADAFSSDAGIKLMNYDGAIALDVVYHFALREIPCFPIHDSFRIARQHEHELREVIKQCYRKHVGSRFEPQLSPPTTTTTRKARLAA